MHVDGPLREDEFLLHPPVQKGTYDFKGTRAKRHNNKSYMQQRGAKATPLDKNVSRLIDDELLVHQDP